MVPPLSTRLLSEFVGTLTIVFVGAGAFAASALGAAGGAGLVTIAIAYGLAVAVMMAALRHISGGHFNPAVTIGAFVTQRIEGSVGFAYIVAQLAGAAGGAALLRGAFPETLWRQSNLGTPLVATGISNGQAVLLEAVLTFFLVFVIFATSIDAEGRFANLAGPAAGFAVIMGVMVAYPFTGASLNPARAFGPAAVGSFWDNHWVHWVGPGAGGIIAASLYDGLIVRRRETRLPMETEIAPGPPESPV
jgi:aquaporin Z